MLKDEKYWCECINLLNSVVDSTRFPGVENTIATINNDIVQVMLKEEKEHKEDLEKLVPAMTKEIAELNKMLDSKDKILEELHDDRANWIKKFNESESHISDLEKTCDSWVLEKEKEEKEKNEAILENRELKSRIEELEKEKSDLEEKIKTANRAENKISLVNSDLMIKISELKKENERLQQENEKQINPQCFKNMAEDYEALKKDYYDVCSVKQLLLNDKEKLEKENKEFKEGCNNVYKQYEDLCKNYSDLQKKYDEIKLKEYKEKE